MDPLSSAHWPQIDALFAEALSHPSSVRTAVLRHRCGTDRALYQTVTELLDQVDKAESFLGESVTDFAASVLPALQANFTAASIPTPSGEPRIGLYRLTSELGAGGMGIVYLAEHEDDPTGTTVALKLPWDIREFFRCLRYEQRILASLDHPGIVQPYDWGTSEDGRPYLVMEYVEGCPIDQYCDAHRLPVEARLELFEAVCEAVGHAHRRRVVHCDLKPSNILITEEGAVKLLDFGIATVLAAPSAPCEPQTRIGERVMTLEYAAPEQLRSPPETLATDVYALGVLLYELLTGRRPLDLSARSFADAETALLTHRPDRPSAVVTRPIRRRQGNGATETLSPDAVCAIRQATPASLRRQLEGSLDAILLTALRKDPERRYASATALLDDVHHYRAGH